MSSENKKPRVAISVGDTNGIGCEIIIKTLADRAIMDFFTPVIFGSTRLMNHYAKLLKTEGIQFHGVSTAKDAVDRKINTVNLWKELPDPQPGVSTKESGHAALESLKAAAESVKKGDCDVLVTAPIDKHNIQSEEFQFPGHTEYLGEVWGGNPLMFLVSDQMKVAVVTQHIPLKEVAEKITQEAIIEKVREISESLIRDFRVQKPKIAVLGLNPHSGDKGLLGSEEQEIIIPAVQSMLEKGVLTFGPYAADSFFSPQNLGNFDAVLGMYHDQVLTPFKTICFDDGVNYTANLPFVRTSPDHGVAFDIAGRGTADHHSFMEAVYAALEIYKVREEYKELTANPLKHYELKSERRSR